MVHTKVRCRNLKLKSLNSISGFVAVARVTHLGVAHGMLEVATEQVHALAVAHEVGVGALGQAWGAVVLEVGQCWPEVGEGRPVDTGWFQVVLVQVRAVHGPEAPVGKVRPGLQTQLAALAGWVGLLVD